MNIKTKDVYKTIGKRFYKPNDEKYRFLISKREKLRKHYYDNAIAFSWYSNDINNTYEKINEYNPTKRNKKC